MSHPIVNRDRLHTQPEDAHAGIEGQFETPQQEAAEDYGAVRVHVTNPVATSTADVQFGIYETIVVPASGNQQVLPRDPLRQYAYIMPVDEPVVLSTTLEASQATTNQAAGNSPASLSSPTGSQTSPGIGQVITSLALPAGTYTVSWTVGLGGTTSATDVDNFELLLGAAQLMTSMNASGSGSNYPQPGTTIVVPAGGATVAISAIAAGTAASVYRGQFTATPQGSQPGPSFPSGAYLPALMWTPAIRHNDPVYAANTSATPTRVVIMVERGAQE
jgi:hypothetical protein